MQDITRRTCVPWYFELFRQNILLIISLIDWSNTKSKNHYHICINLVISFSYYLGFPKINFRKLDISCKVQLPRSNFYYPVIWRNGPTCMCGLFPLYGSVIVEYILRNSVAGAHCVPLDLDLTYHAVEQCESQIHDILWLDVNPPPQKKPPVFSFLKKRVSIFRTGYGYILVHDRPLRQASKKKKKPREPPTPARPKGGGGGGLRVSPPPTHSIPCEGLCGTSKVHEKKKMRLPLIVSFFEGHRNWKKKDTGDYSTHPFERQPGGGGGSKWNMFNFRTHPVHALPVQPLAASFAFKLPIHGQFSVASNWLSWALRIFSHNG